MSIPNLVAHRGMMETFPENTVLSLEAALQCGAAYVEFDVQCSSDGELVVIHDTDLQRTAGISGCVLDMTLDQLRAVRVHEPDRFSLAFFNELLPTLRDVVRLLQHYPKAMAFVEIKPESIERFGIETLLPKLLETLDTIRQRCIMISYHDQAIAYVQEHSDLQTGWVLRHYDDASHQRAIELNPDFLIVQHRKLPADREPWPGDWHWMVYDITDPELAIHYSSYNIPLIETRNICGMLEHPLLALNAGTPDV
jgi:glycerophosphoryl diester phosphodiesterase